MVLRRRRQRPSVVSAEEASREIDSDPFAAGLRADLIGRENLIGRLRALRELAGLTQAEVATRMRTSQSVISEFESAETDPHTSTLQRYARAVDHVLEFRLSPHTGLSDAAWTGSGGLAAFIETPSQVECSFAGVGSVATIALGSLRITTPDDAGARV